RAGGDAVSFPGRDGLGVRVRPGADLPGALLDLAVARRRGRLDRAPALVGDRPQLAARRGIEAALMPALNKTITIVHKQGLHARPAALFVQMAKKFDCRVTVKKG